VRRPAGTHPIYWRSFPYSPPDDWSDTRISDMAHVTKGKLPKTLLPRPSEKSIPYLLIDGLNNGSSLYTEDVDLPLITPEDTVVVADGSRSGLPIRGVSGALGSTLLRYRAKEGFDGDYLYYLLESLYPFTNTATIGGAVPHLDKRLLSQLVLKTPGHSERKIIGRVLRAVDEMLSATSNELLAAQRLKTALMQQLFTKGIPGRHSEFQSISVFRRQTEIPKEWEPSLLGVNTIRIEYGTNAPSNVYNAGYPVIAIPQVVAPRLELVEVPYADLSEVEAATLRLEDGDVLLIRTNGNPNYMGKSTLVTAGVASQHVVFASYLIRIRTDKTRLLGSYLNYFLASPLGRQQALAMSNTSAGNHNLGARSLKRFLLPRPDIKEQEEIVDVLDHCEDELDAISNKISALVRLKKSLLQNLLTGKVRVNREAQA